MWLKVTGMNLLKEQEKGEGTLSRERAGPFREKRDNVPEIFQELVLLDHCNSNKPDSC